MNFITEESFDICPKHFFDITGDGIAELIIFGVEQVSFFYLN